MTEHWNNKGRIIFSVVLIVFSSMLLALCYSLYPDKADSGPYLNSTHGNTSYGVDRRTIDGVNLFPDYAIGNCAHCHEQHASVGGVTTTPSKYVLFYDNYVSQTDAFCFKCHDNTTSYATTAIVNRSYSYRAGGWNSDTLNDILEAFTNPPSISSHNLGNITTFITGKWGYTADSNPCAACHNPHMALGDPANSPSSAKSSVTRGYSPVSRPSLHSKDNNAWGLWGDDNTERMNFYTPNYQAPYRYNTFSFLEPQGDSSFTPATASANTTDFVTFCTDCHTSTSNSVWSTTLSRWLRPIDWNVEKHGKGNANDAISMNDPYDTVMGKVLACTDCHEPHGAPNVTLIRREVNGATLGTITTIDPFVPPSCSTPYSNYDATKAGSIANLCDRCHKDDYDFNTSCQQDHWYIIHHDNTSGDPFYTGGMCGNCHAGGMGPDNCNSTRTAINCNCCHYHGSTYTYGATTWRTF